MIPDFNDEGFLEPGAYETDIAEIKEKLMVGARRRELIWNLEQVLCQMREAGVRRVLVDGSFVSDKPRPSDIDACYDVDDDVDLPSLAPYWPAVAEYIASMRSETGLDLRPSEMIEGVSGKPYREFFQSAIDGTPKGILAISL